MNPNNNNYHQDIHQSDTSNKTLNTNDNWIEKIWAWADEFELKHSEIPRNKESLLALKKLEILEPEHDEQHSKDVYRIAYLPDELTNLTNLVDITISGICSSHLLPNIGKLTNLTKLSISHSKLVALPESIGQLSYLTELFIDQSELEALPDSIGQLHWSLSDSMFT